jgi:hypothetical protein
MSADRGVAIIIAFAILGFVSGFVTMSILENL